MNPVAEFDAAIIAAISAMRSPALTAVMRVWTTLGGGVAVTAVVVVVCAVGWRIGRRDVAVAVAVSVAGGMLLSTALKLIVARGRPSAVAALIAPPGTHSFPSGHAMASLCLAAAIGSLVLLSRRSRSTKTSLVGVLALYALGVGFSRVYLGVHWPSDVVASWLLGGVWLSVAPRGLRSLVRAAGTAGNPTML